MPQLIRVKGVTGVIVSERWRIHMRRLLSESGGESGRCTDVGVIKAWGNPS